MQCKPSSPFSVNSANSQEKPCPKVPLWGFWHKKHLERPIQRIYKFQETKFKALEPQKQIKAVERLQAELEHYAGDASRFEALREELQHLLSWMDADNRKVFSCLMQQEAVDREVFLRTLLDLRAQREDLRDSDMAILKGDGLRWADQSSLHRASRIVVILDNLRSAFNVGSIFRTAECLGLGELALCGITAVPPHPKLVQTAMGTEDKVAWQHFDDSLQAIGHYRALGYQIVALETAETAESIFQASVHAPLALVLGNESLGLEQKVLQQADRVVMLPVQGWKNSLNVGVAFAVCAYQLVYGK